MILDVVRLYLETSVLMAAGFLLFRAARAAAEALGGPQPPRRWLNVGRALLLLAFALPVAARVVLRGNDMFPAPMQVAVHPSPSGTRLSLTLTPGASPATAGPAKTALGSASLAVLAIALLGGSAVGLALLLRQAHRLGAICRRAVVVRRIGRVSILVSTQTNMPFSTAAGLRAVVVLPEPFVLVPRNFSLALTHELQHLRARDVAWTQAMAVLAGLLPWHPAAYTWMRALVRLQELACDQRVLARRGSSPGDYGACLLWAAELARGARCGRSLTVAMLERSRSFLERRIRMIVSPRTSARPFWIVLIGAPALAALVFTAAVVHGAVADRRVTTAEAKSIADDLFVAKGFRVPVDELVVQAVNQVLGTTESRASFREGLSRLSGYEAVGGKAMGRHGVPVALLAIPLHESRVRPLPVDLERMQSGGIWQFIPGTARRYGLVVAGAVDQRFEPDREADAAGRFLADLHTRFGNWALAIAAYNQGPDRVQAAIARTGAREPATLVEAKVLSRYYAAVLAAMLIAHRPSLLE